MIRAVNKIAKSELATLFYSPIAWLILIIFTYQAYSGYISILGYLVDAKVLERIEGWQTFTLFVRGGFAPFPTIQATLYLYIPLLTMGLMSREYSSGSIKLLFSSPVSSAQIIFGKFLAIVIYGAVLVGLLLVLVLAAAFIIKDMDWPLALSGVLGLFLLLCTYASIGLFMSTLTSYQIVAALGTLVLISALNYVGGLWQDIEGVRDIMYWFSLKGRVNEFMNGLICSEDLLYFFIVSGMFITLSILKLQFDRKSSTVKEKVLKYMGVIVCTIVLGYVTSRPAMQFFLDMTEHEQRTLTPNSQEVLNQLDGGMTITSYVNLMDDVAYRGLPGNWANERHVFSQYIRFKPEIKMEYVYFYDNVGDSNMSEEEMKQHVDKILLTSNLNPKKVLTPAEIREKVDLSSEKNHFVRIIERENGQKAVLRIFDGADPYPGEMEISSVLKTFLQKSPHVAFLTGHGERDIYRAGDINYKSFSTELRSKDCIANQGYEISALQLKQGEDVPEIVDVLVIADPREAFTESEQVAINNFINRGGNLILLAESARKEYMEPLLSTLGLEFVPGMLVQNGADYSQELVFSSFTPTGAMLESRFSRMVELDGKVSMPTATALRFVEDKGFKVIPLLQTDSVGYWNSMDQSSLSGDGIVINSALGEKEQTYTTAFAMQRDVNGKDQRIFVLGDADCISNVELSTMRAIRSGNYALLYGMFRWTVYDEFPIDVSRPAVSDNDIYLSPAGFGWLSIFLKWICPLLLLLSACFIWFSRQMK